MHMQIWKSNALKMTDSLQNKLIQFIIAFNLEHKE